MKTFPAITSAIVLALSTLSAHAEVDVSALEKRVAALEAEVATLKAQKTGSDKLEPEELDPDTRRKRVADEVRRRRATRDALDAKRKAKETVAPQDLDSTPAPTNPSASVTPPAKQESPRP